jgi:hypothetical protein
VSPEALFAVAFARARAETLATVTSPPKNERELTWLEA